jgi:hypothetical protein
MSVENPLWGAPRIHGELLKLGFEIAQSSVKGGDSRPGLGADPGPLVTRPRSGLLKSETERFQGRFE